MKTEALEKLFYGVDRAVSEFALEGYYDEWLVELVDRSRITARAELLAIEQALTKAIRLAETIWHRQVSNPEDCLMDAIDLMKTINPDHPMVTAKTFREERAAKQGIYAALREENERLRKELEDGDG